MAALFCPNCGKSIPQGAKFCESCGYSLQSTKDGASKSQQPPSQFQQPPPQYQQQPPPQYQQQPPPQYQQGGDYPPPQYQQGGFMGRFQKPPDYIRPPNYVQTKTMSQRIKGTIKLNVHVVEEIESRPELQDEAMKLLIVSLLIKTIVEIISILSFSKVYIVTSESGTIVQTILTSFVGGFVFIYLLANVGQFIGGRETNTNPREMLRMLSYAYVMSAISDVVAVIEQIENVDADIEEGIVSGFGLLLMVISLILTIYSFIVFAFVIRRALDRGYGITIITIILSAVILLIFSNLAVYGVESVFGKTWEFVPQPK